jgi:C4-dicarboxylate-specific signal transduction histidine kinase
VYPRDEITSELRKTNLSRTRYGYLAQLIVITLSVWFQTGFRSQHWYITMGLAVLGGIFRWRGSVAVNTNPVLSDRLLSLGFFLFGVAWSHHFFRNFNMAVPLDGKQFILLFAISGTIYILLTTLVGDPVSYFSFTTPIAVTILGLYGYPNTFEDWFLFLCILIMICITSISFLHQHRQLRSSILSRLETTRERQRLKRVMDGIPGYVGITDKNGVYVDGNENILSILPNLIGTRVGELTNMSSYGNFVNHFLNSNKETQAEETDAILNGQHQNLMTTCGRLEDGGMIVINIPINELVKTRKELREKEAAAQYSSKLASLGQMAAGVAHEVNNPLAIIQGSASIIAGLVKEENIDRENLKVFSDRIITTTDRIAQIVRSLRTLSRGGEKDPFSPLSLQKVISSCVDISNHNLKQNDVKLMIPENKKDLMVLGREVQLGQVLLNLLSNSIDAVKDLPERWVSVDYGHVDGQVWIEVVDSGKGINSDIAEKMMDPFFTTKPKEEGTGLGLSISSKIIEEHGGRLSYERGRPNTSFRVTFPSPKI